MAGYRLELQEANAWGRTSALLSMLYNSNRGKLPAKTPDDFNPFKSWHRRRMHASKPDPTPAEIGILRSTFIDQRPAE